MSKNIYLGFERDCPDDYVGEVRAEYLCTQSELLYEQRYDFDGEVGTAYYVDNDLSQPVDSFVMGKHSMIIESRDVRTNPNAYEPCGLYTPAGCS